VKRESCESIKNLRIYLKASKVWPVEAVYSAILMVQLRRRARSFSVL
jgi:hypothetical protein